MASCSMGASYEDLLLAGGSQAGHHPAPTMVVTFLGCAG